MTAAAEGPTSRERVVSAATELFVRDGYRSTSMKAIASHVGISPPALYWHFPSKEELYLTSMEALLDEFIAYVEERITGSDAVVRLRQFVSAHVSWRLEEREAAGAFTSAVGSREVFDGLPESDRSSLTTKQRGHLDRLGGILAEGRRAGRFRDDSRVTALAVITMCNYVSTWYDPVGKLDARRVAELYGDCVLRMLEVPGRGEPLSEG